MKYFYYLWTVLLLAGRHGNCILDIETDDASYGINNYPTTLRCNVNSDLSLKEVIWYKGTGSSSIYYYEPPKFNTAILDRASLSSDDNTSLILSPVYLDDEGIYRCHIAVWDDQVETNSPTDVPAMPPIPEEADAYTNLIVYVPPSEVQLTTFASGKNLSLTCKAKGAKPPAQITWLEVTQSGSHAKNPSKKTIIEQNGKLADSIGHLYYQLSEQQNAAQFSCVVSHPESNTVMYKNVTMVSPIVQNAVNLYLDKLGTSVPYSSYSNQHDPDDEAGYVKIDIDPGQLVPLNSSVTMTASAPDVFPEPSFAWWTGDQDVYRGPVLEIPYLLESREYFLLAENPVGQAVISIQLTAVGDDYIVPDNTNRTDNTDVDEVPTGGEMHGGLIAACVIGALVAVLLISLTVWYCTCKNPPNEDIPSKKMKKKHVEETDAFISSDKPLTRTTSTQTLEREQQKGKKRSSKRKDRQPPIEDAQHVGSPPNNLGNDTPPPGYVTKERALTKHLADYDESASFVGDYGSRFGLASNASKENIQEEHEVVSEISHSAHSAIDSDESEDEKVYKIQHSASEATV